MGFRPLPWLSVFAIAALTVLIGLGAWQLQRAGWKRALLAAYSARADAAPTPIFDALARLREGEDVRFLRVAAMGRYDHDHSILLAAIHEGRPGWRVIAPMSLEDSRVVIAVDRGFWAGPPPTLARGAQETTTVTGVIRPFFGAGPFTPPADLERGLFYGLSREALAARTGVEAEAVAPVALAALSEAPPQPGPALRPAPPSLEDIPDNHIGYAITWFGLALALLGVYAGVHIQAGRLNLRRPR